MIKGIKMHPLIKFLIYAIVAYLIYLGMMYFMQRRMLFPRHFIPSSTGLPASMPDIERIWVETSFGKVETWFLPAIEKGPDGKAPAVIFAHGNAELIDFWPRELRRFNDLGMGLLLVEYPGYGRSDGSPSQKSITEAFVSAYDMLISRPDVDPARIGVFVRSVGGGAACALAAKRPTAAMILMSSFISVRSFAIRYFAPGFLIQDPFDNLAVVQSFSGPILIIHGKYDSIIPYDHGKALYEASENAKMITYECGHNSCPPGWSIFWRDVEAFLEDNHIIGKNIPLDYVDK